MNPKIRTLALFSTGGALLTAALMFSPGSPVPTPPAVTPAEAPQPARPPIQIVQEPVTPVATPDQKAEAPTIQVALLLDTSGSMSGLIDQAKSQLWRMVNELSEAKRGGKTPRVELALYEYGSSHLSEREGYARLIVPFTSELDRVSEALFALGTDGGEEFAGNTIRRAINELEWSKKDDALRMIFVAGNEPFDQGRINPYSMVKLAAQKGVIVNTIYCGSGNSAEAAGWRQGAMLADGRFLTIDHNYQVAEISAPQDKVLAEMGVELNTTYIPYGRDGSSSFARQAAQDNNSSGFGMSNLGTRAASKASGNYYNPSWDLVDAIKDNRVDAKNMEEAGLPDNMKKMSAEERAAYVAAQTEKRSTLQAKIKSLSAERERFLAAERQKQANAPTSLDVAMVEAVRSQASKHGFKFE